MSANFNLAYGGENIPLNLKEQFKVLTPPPYTLPKDPVKLISETLSNPLGTPPLSKAARAGDKVAVVVSDQTRVTGSKTFLPLLIEELSKAGVSHKDITIIFATGNHNLPTLEEKNNIIGKQLLQRIKTVNHEAGEKQDMVLLGKTSRGTPVKLNKHYIEADFKIITGSIVHHYFAGFGGGRKSILPGIASEETILANHKLVFDLARDQGIHPGVIPGNLEGNPVHEDMLEAAAKAPPDFMFNTIVDMKGNIIDAVSGDYQQAHLKGCRKAEELYAVNIDEGADLVIASCGGYPKDINMIQIQKTLYNVSLAVKQGGTIILLAECPEGIGSSQFLHWFERLSPGAAEKILRDNFELNGFTALSVMRINQKSQVVYFTRLDHNLVRKMGMVPANSLEEALEKAPIKKDPLIYVIPFGSITVPKIK